MFRKVLKSSILFLLCMVVLLAIVSCDKDQSANNGECVHQYSSWSITKNATCSGDGVQSRTCEKCGYMETQAISALGHTVVIDKAVKATCTTTGLTEGKHCSVCEETIVTQETIAALGHTEVTDTAQSASCTTTGLTEGKHCSTCNEVLLAQQIIPALGHTEVVDKAGKEATCTDTGLTEQKHCSVCNTVLSNQTVIPAKGHAKVVDVAGKAATCTDAGWSESSHCSTCNVVLSEKKTIDATGHVEATDLAKAATCTAAGLTEGKHCSVCNYVIVKQNTIPATGHTVVVDAAVAATCTATGLTEGSHCSTCNTTLVKQNTVAKLSSHTYISGVCKHCGKSDPNYVPTYSAGETWIVDGQFEFTINSVVRHRLCSSSYLNNYNDIGAKTAVIVNYTYKNIGSGELSIGKSSFTVYDSAGTKGDSSIFEILCDHGSAAGSCINGGSCSAQLPIALVNDGSSITIIIKKSNKSATFTVNVTDAPAEEPEEDKLNGCTINLGTSLPQTISYYTYSGSKQSSCSVTEVSFEVSGDDLYIYFTGRKTYDSRGSGQSDSCKIGWKLYDNNNNVIASGTAYTLSIATGEGFVKTKDTAYNCITAGGTYKLVLLNVN